MPLADAAVPKAVLKAVSKTTVACVVLTLVLKVAMMPKVRTSRLCPHPQWSVPCLHLLLR